MSAPRLRHAVSFAVIAATTGGAVAIGSHPFASPTPTAVAPPAAASGAQVEGVDASLAAREAGAAARLRLAERRLRAVAASARSSASAPAVAAPPAPVVSVAPAPVAPVTSSASS